MIQEERDVMKMIGEVMEPSSAEAPKRRGRRPKPETKAVQAIPPQVPNLSKPKMTLEEFLDIAGRIESLVTSRNEIDRQIEELLPPRR